MAMINIRLQQQKGSLSQTKSFVLIVSWYLFDKFWKVFSVHPLAKILSSLKGVLNKT
jgi:hypothetical protein